MKLTVSHRYGHHVVQLHLRHQRSHELFCSIHDIEKIDAGVDSELIEHSHGDFSRNVPRTSSQTVQGGIDERRAAAIRFHTIGNRELKVAMPVKTEGTVTTLACRTDVSPNILCKHASG